MTLVRGKELLIAARRDHYAVPGFNCVEDIMVRGILDRAEKCRAPVFMMCYVEEMDERSWWYLPAIVAAVAPHYTIPIVLHLDHSSSLDAIARALDCGFTSVMYDGSALPFDENVANSRRAVEMAKPYGASVEAELGLVGGFNMQRTSSTANILTQPEEVVRFVNETGVDSLAVSIGTAHGVYEQLPNLDIELLKKLDAVSSVPLVLHGGSGTPPEQIQAAVKNGICKMNVYADSRVAMWQSFKRLANEIRRTDPLPREFIRPMQQDLGDAVEAKIRILSAQDRV
ncbi:MAG: class II fructose-bisphosphate aldolase [Thermoguttaceae bacterium]